MGKHCDLGHIIDPSERAAWGEDPQDIALSDPRTSLTFDLMVAPSHKGHIVGPGEYQLEIFVAAENARPVKRTIAISLRGDWHADERKMLRDGVGVTVE